MESTGSHKINSKQKIVPQQNDNAGNIIHQQITEIQVPKNPKTQLQQKPQICK